MHRPLGLLREVLAEARAARVPFLAAAVAYYAFVSLVPLLLLALAMGSLVGGEMVASAVVEELGGLLTAEGESLVQEAVTQDRGRSGATVVGVLLLIWSGLKVFRAVDAAFSEVYGVDSPESLGTQVREATIVLGSVGLGITVVVGLNGILPAVSAIPAPDLLGVVLTLVLLPVIFLPIYYAFPDVPMTLAEAFPGAILASVGWVALVLGYRVYAEFAATASLYGVLGGVLLLVTFLYLAATVMIAGAVANAVLGGRTDDEEVEPEPDELPEGAPNIREMARNLEAVRTRLEDRTVDRDDLEGDLRRYVRKRMRRDHARGWGPYLVLLYGTAMTIGAFYFLSGGWAILAMLVVWLSTLGMYTLMLIVGWGIGAASAPGRLLDWIRSRRS
jgi:membrane protein